MKGMKKPGMMSGSKKSGKFPGKSPMVRGKSGNAKMRKKMVKD